MSDLLERIVSEIRERLAASRAAVLEHKRLEAALHALEDTAARATRTVSGRGPDQRGGASAPSAKRSSATGRRAAAATSASGNRRASTAATNTASKTQARARSARRDGQGTPARKRAPRGANREAVLRVVGERPGVSVSELAAVSGVQGGTLYALLRTLTERGELEKRDLPAGQTGYVLATSPSDG